MRQMIFILVIACATGVSHAQIQLEFLGLANHDLTSLDINYGFAAVGSDRNGVYWQAESTATDTGWTQIRMDSSVQAVYPHKSGPLGWAISAGIQPGTAEPPYVFCSFMGDDFEANSQGFMPSLTFEVTDLDGYPDPTICGETYAVGGRVLYRRNFGDTIWQPVFTATIEGHLQTVKVRQAYPGVVLIGGADGFAGTLLASSQDFGETWNDISPPGMIFGIDFTGSSGDTIFAAASNMIFRTVDAGVTWTTVFMDGIAFHLSEILYIAEQNTVYAAGRNLPGGEAFLLVSHDFGNQWDPIQLNNLGSILGLEAGTDDWIYFVTRDEGVFRFREGTTDVDDPNSEISEVIVLHQNYPNPFNEVTHIDFEIPESRHVVLKILSVSGDEMITLVDERMPLGRHSLMWDASAMPDGVYLVSLNAGNQSVTRNALVMRR